MVQLATLEIGVNANFQIGDVVSFSGRYGKVISPEEFKGATGDTPWIDPVWQPGQFSVFGNPILVLGSDGIYYTISNPLVRRVENPVTEIAILREETRQKIASYYGASTKRVVSGVQAYEEEIHAQIKALRRSLYSRIRDLRDSIPQKLAGKSVQLQKEVNHEVIAHSRRLKEARDRNIQYLEQLIRTQS